MKLVVLGGSSVASPALVLALAQSGFADIEVVLVGRSADKLEIVTRASAMAGGTRIRVTSALDPERALTGADVILNQVRVGGLQARQFDETFPTQFGLIGEETLGAGGFFNALRTIPVAVGYAQMAEREAPNAWFVNLTNPAGMVAGAVSRATKLKTLSVCDVPSSLMARLSKTLGSNLEWDWIGVNHVGWLTGIRHRGSRQSLMPQAMDAMAVWRDWPFDPEDVRAMDAIPSAYLRYLLYPHRYQPEVPRTQSRATELQELETALLQQYRRLDSASPRTVAALVGQRQAHWYEKAVVALLQALGQEEPVTMALQVPSSGGVVERPVQVSRSGLVIQPPWAPVPRDVAAWIDIFEASESLAVEAILSGDREQAVRALAINPLVGDWTIARQLVQAVWPNAD